MTPDNNTSQVLTILPLRNSVLFPYLFMPLTVGRPSSLAAVEGVLASEDKNLVVVAQRHADGDQAGLNDLFTIGTRAVVKKMARGQDTVELLVQGIERVSLLRAEQKEPFLKVCVQPLPFPEDGGAEVDALYRTVLELMAQAVELSQGPNQINVAQLAAQAPNPLHLAYWIGSMLSLDVAREQALLEAPTRLEALRLVHGYLAHELQVLSLRQKINSQAQTELSKQQRDILLRQQLQAIQQELGEQNPEKAEVEELRRRLTEADLPDEVRKEADRELARLERLPAIAPDHQVIRTYLELILELPWRKGTEDVIDLKRTRQVLDEDHYDLEEIKERILEHLAVLKLNPGARRPSSAWWERPAWAKPRWASRSPGPWAGNSSASPWAACTTRPSCAAIAAPTSAPCPAPDPGHPPGRRQQSGPDAR